MQEPSTQAVREQRGGFNERAQLSHCDLALRALASQEMRHERKFKCCVAAEEPAIGSTGSMYETLKLQVARQRCC